MAIRLIRRTRCGDYRGWDGFDQYLRSGCGCCGGARSYDENRRVPELSASHAGWGAGRVRCVDTERLVS